MTPVQSLIALNPTSAVLITTAPEDYDPSSEADYLPGARVFWPTVGAYSGVKLEGADYDATLLVDADDLPPFFEADGARVGVEEGEYGIKRIRPRRGFGRITGYTLELGL